MAGDEAFRLPLLRAAMAEALGLLVETVSRHMNAFQQDGLIAISGLRGVRLLNRARLGLNRGSGGGSAGSAIGHPLPIAQGREHRAVADQDHSLPGSLQSRVHSPRDLRRHRRIQPLAGFVE